MQRLLDDPTCLRILGDGSQSKSYIHVFDVVNAVLLAHSLRKKPFEVFNVATGDYITVTQIAELAMEVTGLQPGSVNFEYSGGNRGWKGDVPVVRLNTDRIQSLGWSCRRTSRQALCVSMTALLSDAKLGKF